MDERYVELGKTIASHRARRGLTQRELAEVTGVTHGEIGKVEAATRRPSAEMLARLARALDVDVEELYELGGYGAFSDNLKLPTYLRRRYGLPGEATAEVERYFAHLQDKYGTTKGDDDGNEHPRSAT